ncbi:MAG: putative DNA binding domain-containing protein [Clostridiales bacterium]|nr:putative DNA binding domain-containing protein [Clostridiales bacterium]
MNIHDYEKAETSNIDYKEELEEKKPKSWLKSVSAFANTKGGIILFGINDKNHTLVGLKDIQRVAEKITELINSKITPLPRYEINTFSEDGKDYLELKIGDGPSTPYYFVSDGRKEVYIRAGNQSLIAPEHVLNNLILKGKNLSFDALSTKYLIKDLSFTLLGATLKEKTGNEFNEIKDYISLGLASEDGHITNAGVLLSDQGALKQSKIVCTRWKGKHKGVLSEDAIDDKEYTGSIISLLENADLFIKNNSKQSWKIVGMNRIELEDYPATARREAIVNALIHRDYQILGAEIHIDMFDDRLEITSPGGMFDGSLIQNLEIKNIPSMRRNVIISDVFSRLHFMERRGSGLSRIVESYSDSELKPKFISDSLSFSVIFPNKSYSKNTEDEKNKNLVSDEELFFIKLYKSIQNAKIKNSTIDQIKVIFDKVGYSDVFSRDDVKTLLNVKDTRATNLIALLLELNLIKKVEGVTYKFFK